MSIWYAAVRVRPFLTVTQSARPYLETWASWVPSPGACVSSVTCGTDRMVHFVLIATEGFTHSHPTFIFAGNSSLISKRGNRSCSCSVIYPNSAAKLDLNSRLCCTYHFLLWIYFGGTTSCSLEECETFETKSYFIHPDESYILNSGWMFVKMKATYRRCNW